MLGGLKRSVMLVSHKLSTCAPFAAIQLPLLQALTCIYLHVCLYVCVGWMGAVSRSYSASAIRMEDQQKREKKPLNRPATGWFKEHKEDEVKEYTQEQIARSEGLKHHTDRIYEAQTREEPVAVPEPKVGEHGPEPEVYVKKVFRGIDRRPLSHRIHSVLGNHPFWGPSGTWQMLVCSIGHTIRYLTSPHLHLTA